MKISSAKSHQKNLDNKTTVNDLQARKFYYFNPQIAES